MSNDSIPANSIEKCLLRTQVALTSGIGQAWISRSEMAKAMGFNGDSGSFSELVLSAYLFGILERAEGKYRISDMTIAILSGKDDVREQALRIAALRPRLHGELCERYAGQLLPANLGDIIRADYGVDSARAGRAASAFALTMRYAGIYDGVRINAAVGSRVSASESAANQTGIQPTPGSFEYERLDVDVVQLTVRGALSPKDRQMLKSIIDML